MLYTILLYSSLLYCIAFALLCTVVIWTRCGKCFSVNGRHHGIALHCTAGYSTARQKIGELREFEVVHVLGLEGDMTLAVDWS